jgi:hypothetical protein
MAVGRCVIDLFRRPTDRLTQHSVIWLFSQVHQTSDNRHRTADIFVPLSRVGSAVLSAAGEPRRDELQTIQRDVWVYCLDELRVLSDERRLSASGNHSRVWT